MNATRERSKNEALFSEHILRGNDNAGDDEEGGLFGLSPGALVLLPQGAAENELVAPLDELLERFNESEALLANDPEFSGVCDDRRERWIDSFEQNAAQNLEDILEENSEDFFEKKD